MNSTDKASLEKFTKELSTMHYVMTFGAFGIAVLIYFFTIDQGQINFSDTDDFFLYICPVLALWGVFGGSFMYRKKINEIDSSLGLADKLAAFRAASIFKFAMLEGPALICIVAAMDTQNLLYMIIAIFLIVYLFTQNITVEKVMEELQEG